MKTRTFPESNYHAVYVNGKTIRTPIRPKERVGALEYPEFYDVKITDKCFGGCPYCYQDSTVRASHFNDVPGKVERFFGSMTENERPFQVAIGGGEPTLHPEFREICRQFKSLGIDPNYTTNGTNLTEEVLDVTQEFVNGVAVSCHEHLPWRIGVEQLLSQGIYTNLHVMISDEESVRRFALVYDEFHGRIKHFVLLPVVAQGRARSGFDCWGALKDRLVGLQDHSDIAFGAMFYPYLSDLDWDISLYEPEAFSRYLVMNDAMQQFPSSFATGDIQ